VCAQRPVPNARGWRSSAQPLASTSRARGPTTWTAVRLADRSTTEPSPASASASSASSAACAPGAATTSHSSGPSQSTSVPPAPATLFGSAGSGKPSAASAADRPAGSGTPLRAPKTRTPTCARNGRSTTRTASDAAAANASAKPASGALRRSSVTARALRVDQHGAGHLRCHDAVLERDVDRRPLARPPVLEQGERERPAERGAVVAGGDEPGHRDGHRSVRVVHELGALRQPLGGEEADELLAPRPLRVRALVRAAPDEVALVLRDHPAEPEVLGRDRPVGVLADDHVALLRAQHVHRLGSVRRDAVRLPRVPDRLPQREPVPRGA